MLLVNGISGGPWHRGIMGGLFVAILLGASTGDKKYFRDNKDKHNQNS